MGYFKVLIHQQKIVTQNSQYFGRDSNHVFLNISLERLCLVIKWVRIWIDSPVINDESLRK